MIDREISPTKPLTSDRGCGSIQSRQFVSVSENQNPNLGHVNRVANCSSQSKTSFSSTEPRTPNKSPSLVGTGKDEAEQVVTSEGKEAGIAAPSPPRRHFCRSPRCASNNPDYAQPASIPLRKFLVSKRHLLLQAKGEIPPPVPKSPASAAATLPRDQKNGTSPSLTAAVSGCVKVTTGAELEDAEGNLGCRLYEEQCEFEQSQVMESEVKQNDDICEHLDQDYGICSQHHQDGMCPRQDDDMNFAAEEEEENGKMNERNQVMESVMKQDDDICEFVEQDYGICSQQDDDEMFPPQDDDMNIAAEEKEEDGKIKELSENYDISMSMHKCNSDSDDSGRDCSNTGLFETPCLVNHTVEEYELPTESTESAESEELAAVTTSAANEVLVAMTTSGECKDPIWTTSCIEVVAPVDVTTQQHETASVKIQTILEKTSSGECKDSIWTSSCIEAAAPVHVTAQQHETASVKTQAILEKKQIRGCRINNAIAEAHRKVLEPLGEGRVRHLVEAFENIISLAETEAEESRVIRSQGSEKAHRTNPGRDSQDLPAAEDPRVCEQSIASSSGNLHEEVKLPTVPVKAMVDMYHNSKQSPVKSTITVKPLDEDRLIFQESDHISYHSSKQSPMKPTITVEPVDDNRLILQAAESDHISHDEHLIETCFHATEFTLGDNQLKRNVVPKEELDASKVEVKRMIDKYNVEMTSLAHARSIDKVRNWNNGESVHGNAGYELWKKLLNSPNVMDRGYLIAHERMGMTEDGRVSVVRPMITVSRDANYKHDQGASTDESQPGNIAWKGENNKDGCTIPARDYLGNEVDQNSNFGVSVCNSFQSQQTGSSFGMNSRKSKSTSLQPFALRTEARGAKKKHDFARKLARMFAEEQRMRIPLAQGLPWTTDEPQALPKPPVKESTVPLEINLFSDIRACERAEFDEYVAERISLMQQQRREREMLKQLQEQEEIKRMRREMVPRAQLMPYFDRPFMPKRSSKRLTIPKGPSFQCNQNKRHKCMVTQG